MQRAILSLAFAAGFASLAAPARAADAASSPPPAATCKGDPALAFAPPRIVEIDAHGGPIFGEITRQAREPSFLRPKEVLLTFDDGPMPWITRSILDTLDAACVRATFFSVGQMALAYPDVVREVAARGHTIGTHTMTHPFNMHRMQPARAEDEIERGFAAVSAAAGAPVAPFFRFPGLADSALLLNYLQQRGIAAFTVDVVTNDSYIASPSRLIERTLATVERQNGGIILFHDIKRATAKALPDILKGLKAKGFTIVHMIPSAAVAPRVDLFANYSAEIAESKKLAGPSRTLMPFYGTVGPTPAAVSAADITRIAPTARPRAATAASPHVANSDATATAESPWKSHVRSHRRSRAR